MKNKVSHINDVKLIKTKIFKDKRGFFYESFVEKKYKNLFKQNFLQDNISLSKKNVIRGLHYQFKPQSQLLTLVYGRIFDVIVDLRKNSKTYKKWMSFNLNFEQNNQVFMPPGVAHGFCVLSGYAILHYKVSKVYDAKNETGIRWNDKDINVNWPIKKPILSSKDKELPYFKDIY